MKIYRLSILILFLITLVSCGNDSSTNSNDNHPPDKPSDPQPINNATDQSLSVNLGWSCSDPDQDSLTYQISFGVSSTPSVIVANLDTIAFKSDSLQVNTTYYWQVVARDIHGATAGSEIWKFTTETALQSLEVITVNPIDEENDVSINAHVSVIFTDSILPSSITDSSFYLTPKVAGTFVVSGYEVVFTPSTPLVTGETYIVTLTTDIKSTSNSTLQQQYTWSFETQQPDTWEHIYSYSGEGVAVARSIEGGYGIVINNTTSNSSQSMVLLVDQFGEYTSIIVYVGTLAISVNDIVDAYGGGYIVTGSIRQSPGSSETYVWVSKISISGISEWTKVFNNSENENSQAITKTLDGGYIITGKTKQGHAWGSIFFLKFDINGNYIWSNYHSSGGGNIGYAITPTLDGGYVATGVERHTTYVSGYNHYVAKISFNGELIWNNSFSDGGLSSYGYDIIETTEGDYLTVGERVYARGYNGTVGESQARLVKLTSSGDVIFNNLIGTSGEVAGHSLVEDIDSGYVIGGRATYLSYLFKTDTSGNVLWERNPGNGAIVYDILCLENGGYVLTGHSSDKVVLLKVSENGEL